jgi:hypothetical protein
MLDAPTPGKWQEELDNLNEDLDRIDEEEAIDLDKDDESEDESEEE